MTGAKRKLLIVGAGFSRNAGLPLASEFTRELLDLKRLHLNGPSTKQVTYIRRFVDEVFGEGRMLSHAEWPELEDIFTLLDLSANTGHHLGPNFSASDLRVVRRAVIVRMIRMLATAYRRKRDKPDQGWTTLQSFFKAFDASRCAVLSMNWDTVFEQGVARNQQIENFEYGCNASAVRFQNKRLVEDAAGGEALTVLKPHGSVNWLYCDACRETVWLPPHQTEQVARTLFRKKDWSALGLEEAQQPRALEPRCLHCGADSLGTRFATFSYRKALDFPMHAATWRTAEEHLKTAADWVFFGYSMPPADFEFKHLLKRVQLTEQERPRITLITGGDDKAATAATVARFKKFFGEVAKERIYLENGLDDAALAHLRKIGVLKP